ncbi:glutamine--fructose-6-phosphate transaminase (isomerizing) [Enterococcus sp. BWB1-3]|uniref:glutamine--fructose-6-phosphate transaminase (isomerizing) n=1 Tax=unclassified Enterococcus TaxID=2608891 RepID=UPI0019235C3C|nr:MULTISPECIES: glutamine--fructose-6-phosphate transaminase (isomerizing) [unclassified Enterococcus]MBL1229642.1 glutamine--fructose-6-phosphate transaminase (isomerizing) [Enterococcus sp. BWB1-3]MCB5951999.1 glutamine--fructose-6-phosphate transaminase (isomerizing) [Enterococcus sp. BWT-B8]MCB5956194.1 glutamine--fructose-6-phosphate transaminase (isomerizing) [Enterococcus sp. CWB-B31]
MCGIVGIIGKENAADILLQGLEKLEYRGYDSAGIYVTDKSGKDCLVKSQGRIADLQSKIKEELSGNIGIGHTRWATHGKPSERNAHPHTSENGRFTLVHNGVIENFEEIKQEFLQNSRLIGETDTEIVVHLINYFADQSGDTKEAFKQTLKVIKGSYAFALIDNHNPEVIYVAKNKSPLLIGLGDGFNVICSDAMAMLQETNHFVEIADGELVVVKTDSIQIEDEKGNMVFRESYEAQLDLNDLEKGTYPYYMLKEIDEQPSVMRRIVDCYTDNEGNHLVDQKIIQQVLESDRIYIVACGTSYHAGWAGKKIFEELTGIPVEVHLSSEFGYNMPLISQNPLFIFLSQSGETADSRQVLVQINQMGYSSLTLTNVPGSTLSREAKHTMLLYAGPEIAVASTKAYTAQIAVLTMLAAAVGREKGNSAALGFDVVHEVSLAAAAMEAIVDEKMMISQLVETFLNDTRNTFYIGRGMDYFVSMEAALKLKEISYIQAEGFAAGELKHGTIALIEEETPVIGIITDQKTASLTRGNLKEVESRGAQTVTIVTESLAKGTDQLVIPEIHPLLTVLVSVVPTQLIAYFATLQRGYDVDKPRNLAKSVTVE